MIDETEQYMRDKLKNSEEDELKPIPLSTKKKPRPVLRGPAPAFQASMQKPLPKPLPKPGIWERIFTKLHLPTKYAKYMPYAIMGLLVLVLIVLVILSLKSAPTVEFYDNKTGELINGTVFYNGFEIGEAKGKFSGLPKEFCRQSGLLEIVTPEGRTSWRTDITDCLTKRLRLSMKSINVVEQLLYVKFQFLTRENSPLSGVLILDGKDVGQVVNGSYMLYQGDCKKLHIINLTRITNPAAIKGYADWENEAGVCQNDIIRYKLPTYTTREEVVEVPEESNEKAELVRAAHEEFMAAIEACSCNCTTLKRVDFCKQSLMPIDLDVNGASEDYVPKIFGKYGVCEDMVYCSMISPCSCDETLDFDKCIKVVCQDLKAKQMTPTEATAELKNIFVEGACQTSAGYNTSSSWYTSYQGRLNCTNS